MFFLSFLKHLLSFFFQGSLPSTIKVSRSLQTTSTQTTPFITPKKHTISTISSSNRLKKTDYRQGRFGSLTKTHSWSSFSRSQVEVINDFARSLMKLLLKFGSGLKMESFSKSVGALLQKENIILRIFLGHILPCAYAIDQNFAAFKLSSDKHTVAIKASTNSPEQPNSRLPESLFENIKKTKRKPIQLSRSSSDFSQEWKSYLEFNINQKALLNYFINNYMFKDIKNICDITSFLDRSHHFFYDRRQEMDESYQLEKNTLSSKIEKNGKISIGPEKLLEGQNHKKEEKCGAETNIVANQALQNDVFIIKKTHQPLRKDPLENNQESEKTRSIPTQRRDAPAFIKETPTPQQTTGTLRQDTATLEHNIQLIQQNTQTPKKNTQTPQKNTQTPQTNTQTPQQNTQPQKNTQTPQKNIQTPQQNIKTPQQNIKTPQQNIQTPQQNIQTPQQNKQPTQQNTQPPQPSMQQQHVFSKLLGSTLPSINKVSSPHCIEVLMSTSQKSEVSRKSSKESIMSVTESYLRERIIGDDGLKPHRISRCHISPLQIVTSKGLLDVAFLRLRKPVLKF